jgi:hypothetical protein
MNPIFMDESDAPFTTASSSSSTAAATAHPPPPSQQQQSSGPGVHEKSGYVKFDLLGRTIKIDFYARKTYKLAATTTTTLADEYSNGNGHSNGSGSGSQSQQGQGQGQGQGQSGATVREVVFLNRMGILYFLATPETYRTFLDRVVSSLFHLPSSIFYPPSTFIQSHCRSCAAASYCISRIRFNLLSNATS